MKAAQKRIKIDDEEDEQQTLYYDVNLRPIHTEEEDKIAQECATVLPENMVLEI